MGKTKINKVGWGLAPNAFYVAAMRKSAACTSPLAAWP